MATKKSADKANETVVSVKVPAVKGVALNDVYRAALTHARDQIPLTSVVEYEIADTKKSGDERTYQVKISWTDVNGTLPGDDDGDLVARQLDSLVVPTAIPGQDDHA